MMKRKRVMTLRAAALFLLGLVLALVLAGCSENEASRVPESQAVRPVKVVTLAGAEDNITWNFPGVARSSRDVDISFRVGGPVVELTVDRGQEVRKGDVIARIDTRDFEVAVETLKANLAVSKAQLKEAELQYNRYRTLNAKDAAAQATFDSITASYEVAQASVDAASKRLEEARNSLVDTTLVAPFDGYVHEKYIENHETVARWQPVVSLVDLEHMEVEVAIPEGLLSIAPEVGSYLCRFDALPGEAIAATFKELSKNPNSSNRSYPLYLTIEGNNEYRVRPGMATEVTMIARKKHAGFLVPETAVVNTDQFGTYIWMVDKTEMVAKQVAVHLLGVNPLGVRIDGALKEGMVVISAGGRGLTNGRKVRLLPEPSSTNVGAEL